MSSSRPKEVTLDAVFLLEEVLVLHDLVIDLPGRCCPRHAVGGCPADRQRSVIGVVILDLEEGLGDDHLHGGRVLLCPSPVDEERRRDVQMKQVLQQFIINSRIVGAAARIESQGRREHPSVRASRTAETSRPNSPGRASAYSAVISSLVGGESVSGSSPAAPSEGGAVVEPEGAVVPEPELAGSAAPPDDREELPEAIALTAPVANSPRRLRRPTILPAAKGTLDVSPW